MRPFDVSYIIKGFTELFPYTGITLLVLLLSLICGTVLGVLLAWGRMSGNRIASGISLAYVHVIRCTPSIVLLFIVFYGLPLLLRAAGGGRPGTAGTYNGKFFSVVAALTMLSAAAFCEIFRAAHRSVDNGQREAAFCCGMNRFQIAVLVVVPQAAQAALPNICTQIIILLKQGSLAFTIGFVDLAGQAQIMVKRSYGGHGLETYAALALIYWLLTVSIEQILMRVQRACSKGLAVVGTEERTWS